MWCCFSAKQLAEAYANKRASEGQEWQGFYPCIDPSSDVIPASPYEIFRQGRQARVPIMVGSNSDEGSLFAPMMPLPRPDAVYGASTELPSTHLNPL